MDLKQHWNAIFASRADAQLGWYERESARTLHMLDLVPRQDAAMAFLPGAGTSVLVDELLGRGLRLVVNDISDAALGKLKARFGERPHDIVWLHHDISRPLPANVPPVDLWIDRAVLHFLLSDAAITGYFDNLRTVLRPGGHVLLAEFSLAGAPKCAGLDVHRYDAPEMAARLGPGFILVRQEDHTFINPAGDERPYVYALFKRSLL